jgi:hypothetical protein
MGWDRSRKVRTNRVVLMPVLCVRTYRRGGRV